MHKIQEALLGLAAKKDLGRLTLRQIGEFIGETHPQKIKHHLGRLRVAGFLTPDNKPVSRSVGTRNARTEGLISVPILGTADCGDAKTYADQLCEGFLQLSPSMIPKRRGLFAIRAAGDSMNRADVMGQSIEEGDFVIVDSTDRNARDGDYVLSVISGSANIKKFLYDKPNHQIVLISESSKELPPIYIHQNDFSSYMISGKVIRVIKKPPPFSKVRRHGE